MIFDEDLWISLLPGIITKWFCLWIHWNTYQKVRIDTLCVSQVDRDCWNNLGLDQMAPALAVRWVAVQLVSGSADHIPWKCCPDKWYPAVTVWAPKKTYTLTLVTESTSCKMQHSLVAYSDNFYSSPGEFQLQQTHRVFFPANIFKVLNKSY